MRLYLSSKKISHLKTCKSFGKKENMIMGPDGTRKQN
jgi:hypothetical protein